MNKTVETLEYRKVKKVWNNMSVYFSVNYPSKIAFPTRKISFTYTTSTLQHTNWPTTTNEQSYMFILNAHAAQQDINAESHATLACVPSLLL